MELSIWFAKVLGLYLLIISLLMFIRRVRFQEIMIQMSKEPPVLFLGLLMAFILGLMIVVTHNVWVMGWPVIVTLIGWMSLAKGVLGLLAVDSFVKLVSRMAYRGTYILFGGITFLLGLFLVLKGFLVL